jgi:hypothetical protein
MPERRNSGAGETAIATQRPCKQATVPKSSLGNESASNNGETVGGGVFCAVQAEAIQEGQLDPQKLALTSPSGSCSVGIVGSQIKATEFSF